MTSQPRASLLPGVIASLLAAASFGSSGVTAKPLLDAGWTAASIVLVRLGGAVILLAVPSLLAMRGRWSVLRPGAGNLGPLVLFGIFGVAAAQVCYFNAVRYVPVSVALLLEFSGIVLVVGWQWLTTRIRPAVATLVGAVVALAGLALVLDIFGGGRISPIGIFWGLGAGVGLAVFFVVGARSTEAVPSVVMVSGGMLIGVSTLGLLALLGVLPAQAALGSVQWAGNTVSAVIPLLWLVMVTAVFAYLIGLLAIRRLGSTLASFVGLTEVLFATLFAWWLLGERPGLVQSLGALLVILGVVLVRVGESRTPAATTPTEELSLEAVVTGGHVTAG